MLQENVGKDQRVLLTLFEMKIDLSLILAVLMNVGQLAFVDIDTDFTDLD